jgi:hypothetical protein
MVDVPVAQNAKPCAEIEPLTAALKPVRLAWTPEGMAMFCPEHEDGMAIFISRAETLPLEARKFEPKTLTLAEMNTVYEAASALPDQMGMLGVSSDVPDMAIALGTAGPTAICKRGEQEDAPFLDAMRKSGVFQRCTLTYNFVPKPKDLQLPYADYRLILLDLTSALWSDDGMAGQFARVVKDGTLMLFGSAERVAHHIQLFSEAGVVVSQIEGTRLWTAVKA